MPDFTSAERLSLARLPTPVQRLDRLSKELGVDLLIKRDDLTGMELSGNKIRKLEFVLAEALAQKSTAVITTGGWQSNHCRATAVAAVMLGMQPHLLLHTADGEPPAAPDGNHLLDLMVGADIRYITSEQYQDSDAHLARWADELARAGERPFTIPSGASTPLGALGYVAMVDELCAQQRDGELPGGRLPDAIAHACGSGGTTAGLALGARVYGVDCKLVSYAVCDDVAYFLEKVDRIIDGAAERFPGLPGAADVSYEVVDEWKGIGYALCTAEELTFLRDFARADGLILDPVYSGKAFRGLVEEIRRGDRYEPGSTVLFVHTGGLFGLFPKRMELTL